MFLIWKIRIKIEATPQRCCQFSSVAQLCPGLCDPIDCRMPGLPVHHQFLEPAQLMSIELVMPSNHRIFCFLLFFLPSIFPSIKVFSSGSALCIRWPKYWSSNSSPSNEYSGLISFQIDWFDLLAVQETLKSLLQHHTLKATILWYSALFLIQLLHLYVTTGKTMA